MVLRCCAMHSARLVVSLALAFPVAFTAIAEAQDTSFESLSDEADALTDVSEPAEFVESAKDILGRANDSLTGDELAAIEDKVDSAAASWVQQSEIGPSLSVDTADFLITHGLAKIESPQRAEVAAEWILQPDAMTRYSAEVVSKLSEAASSELTEEQRAELLSQGRAALGDLASVSYAELVDYVDVRTRHLHSDDQAKRNSRDFFGSHPDLFLPSDQAARAERQQLVADWATEHDPETLDIEKVDWLMNKMMPEYLSPSDERAIDASWEARLLPPRSGEYTFSISSLRLGQIWEEEGTRQYFRQWLTVEVDGQNVLEAAPGDWQFESAAVSLEQNQSVPIKVSLRYRTSGDAWRPAAAGQLYWSGPGVERQLIEPAFYQLPATGDPGVKMTVERRDSSGVHLCETTVSSIDQILGKTSVCAYEQTLDRYIERRVEGFLTPEALDEALAAATAPDPAERKAHPAVGDWKYRRMVFNSPSQLRRRLAARLSLTPEFFQPLDILTISRFYRAFRFGAERESLDLLGTWTMVHAEQVPELAGDADSFYQINRAWIRSQASSLVPAHPQSALWLEEDYLETESGRCSLPAAYTLAYVHLVTGRLLEWIEKLETRLDDSSLSGEERVNWLIARAMAEEIRGCPEDHRTFVGCERLGAGFGWLDEAMLVAESPETKTRVIRERAARLAALQKWDAAEAELEGEAALEDWENELTALQGEVALKEEEKASAADAAFLAEMRRRLSRANAREDSDAASRYTSLIEQLEESSESTD